MPLPLETKLPLLQPAAVTSIECKNKKLTLLIPTLSPPTLLMENSLTHPSGQKIQPSTMNSKPPTVNMPVKSPTTKILKNLQVSLGRDHLKFNQVLLFGEKAQQQTLMSRFPNKDTMVTVGSFLQLPLLLPIQKESRTFSQDKIKSLKMELTKLNSGSEESQ